ncbi:MAG: hypothetical protein HC883_04120 [Bdellovibrionaceae bacterium]|nr:hypothetical protein [Pseudobdellovibrionaceae bacterium]
MLRYLMFITLAFGGWQAFADQKESLWPWDIQSVELQKIEDVDGPQTLVLKNDCSQLNSSGVLIDGIAWDQILSIGEKVWEIVQAGKPVVHIETPVAHALPRGLECWSDLEHWQAARTQTYEVIYKNGFGMEAVKFRFRLHYTYGGGKAELGKYLANVTVLPAELNVLWGYNFDAKVEVQPAINMGSSKDPMAGLELNVHWTVKTVVKESINSFHFFVQGDGVSRSSQ